jgi:hypothetical protein
LGSRFLGQAIGLPPLKRLTLKAGVVFTYMFSDISLSDTHNGFRALSRYALEHISLEQNGMAHASEIIDQAGQKNMCIVEVPVTVRYFSFVGSQPASNAFRIVFDLITHMVSS